jgi:hypothetical protein
VLADGCAFGGADCLTCGDLNTIGVKMMKISTASDPCRRRDVRFPRARRVRGLTTPQLKSSHQCGIGFYSIRALGITLPE